jgi:hypothetical protein
MRWLDQALSIFLSQQQSWDASVKGLTQFSDVLTQVATNLSCTSAGAAHSNGYAAVIHCVENNACREASGNSNGVAMEFGGGLTFRYFAGVNFTLGGK